MGRTRESYENENKAMVYFILQGHGETETAKEFEINRSTLRHRLKKMGYTYADLVEMRESKKKQSR